VHAFRQLVERPETELDLGLAALAVARVEHPDLVAAEYLGRLDELAAGSEARGIADGRRALERLRRFLFEEEGFRGNVHAYYDPRNSCLNDVLERKLGIPITLSVLMMEVGRRLGLAIDGVGLPGHFIVAAHVEGERILVDPFNGGATLSEEACVEVASRAVGRRVRLTAAHFAPSTKRQVVVRMLRNLKTVYGKQGDWAKLLRAVDMLLVADAESMEHVRDRGTALVKLGHLHHGAAEWERYLQQYPHAQDAEGLREQLREVRRELAALN
jgi:regulator of sirC expression with transglutaminase-like and TPR domain